ncbi:MAG: polysaccharide deacetylase family protein [bacterium]|nr:polysaccharide deacetylase family protein [bacterium]
MKRKYIRPGSANVYIVITLLLIISCSKKEDKVEVPLPHTDATVKIAKWKGNKKAALTLQFDDSTPGQATLGIPALNSRNITGTWYVNPGRFEFNDNIDIWENDAPEGGQELANHTMNHSGANSYEETVSEVGEASKVIWRIRNEQDYGSLIAFNRGGGTTWNEDDLAGVLADFKNIDRQSYLGIKVLAKSILPRSNAAQMYEIIPQVLKDSIIGRVHFHGIAAEDGNPPMDYGNGAVWIKDFEEFLDQLVTIKNEIWIGGYIAVYKYIKERETAALNIVQYNSGRYAVNLTSDTDQYYNEPLTVVANLPVDWKNCTVKHNGSESNYSIEKGLLIFDAVPNKGEISITEK